jgi:hypothetical protein
MAEYAEPACGKANCPTPLRMFNTQMVLLAAATYQFATYFIILHLVQHYINFTFPYVVMSKLGFSPELSTELGL